MILTASGEAALPTICNFTRKLLTNLDEVKNIYKGLTIDGAYERYLIHQRTTHPNMEPLPFEEFYRMYLDRKWSGINSCC